MESLVWIISAMVELSLALTVGPRPPMEINSPYAAGSSVPPNEIGTPPFTSTITYCTPNPSEQPLVEQNGSLWIPQNVFLFCIISLTNKPISLRYGYKMMTHDNHTVKYKSQSRKQFKPSVEYRRTQSGHMHNTEKMNYKKPMIKIRRGVSKDWLLLGN